MQLSNRKKKKEYFPKWPAAEPTQNKVILFCLTLEYSVLWFLIFEWKNLSCFSSWELCLIYTVRRQVGCSWVWGRPQGWPQLFVEQVQALQEPCISFATIPEKMNKSSTFHGEKWLSKAPSQVFKALLNNYFHLFVFCLHQNLLSSENLGLYWYHSKTQEYKFF